MKRIGIDESERRKRDVAFYSWRHYFNSLLVKNGVPTAKIQFFTGHSSDEMAEHYTQFNAKDFPEVVEVQEHLVSSIAN